MCVCVVKGGCVCVKVKTASLSVSPYARMGCRRMLRGFFAPEEVGGRRDRAQALGAAESVSVAV